MNTKKGSVLTAGLIEFGIIAVLVIVISGVLNYFNIIPLSNTFPFLSFLPHQESNLKTNLPLQQNPTSKTQSNKAIPRIIHVVSTSAPVVRENKNAKKASVELLEKSFIKTNSLENLTLIIGLSLKTGANTSRSGLLLGDNFKDQNSKRMFLSYNPKDQSWSMRYEKGKTRKYIELFKNSGAEISAKITLRIVDDGKRIVAILPDGSKKSMLIPESLYESSNSIHIISQVAPSSTLTINSLSYSASK